jgi:hypothetical protein
MSSRRTNHLRAVFCISLLGAASAPHGLAVQAQSAVAPARIVPIEPGTCATVPVSGTVSLDWNPGFDHESVVSSVDRFSLIFTAVAADGVTPLRPGGPGMYAVRSTSVTPLANGYYHFEFQVPRTLQPGTFRVVDAAAAPHLVSGYRGPAPQMTHSAARERLCITVVEAPRSQTTAPIKPGS